MAIWLTKDSKVIVQGMTGSEGSKHTRRMLAAGTNVVGGVNPRKAGQSVDFDGTELPVFASVADAMKETGADVTVIFVPPAFTKAAVVEAIDAEIPLAVVITEGVPVHDTAAFWAYNVAKGSQDPDHRAELPRHRLARRLQRRHHPGRHHRPGRIGLVSKSGTLTYQMMYELRDIGFSTCVGIGGDPIIGTTHIDALAAFEADPETDAIVMIGEIGGDAEERAAEFIKANVTKPVVGYIAGFTAPARQDHGARRRDHLGFGRHRRREEGGARGGRRQGRQDADRDRQADAGDHVRSLSDNSAWRGRPATAGLSLLSTPASPAARCRASEKGNRSPEALAAGGFGALRSCRRATVENDVLRHP